MKRITYIILAMALSCQFARAQRPNIILFLVDDMGWADWQHSPDLNPTGSDLYETPAMDRLARHGIVFTNAYAACPVCSPSRAAIMTGKTPARLRLTEWISGGRHETASLKEPPDWVKNLSDSEVTLAEALKDAGYRTAFIGKWHLGQSGNPSADPLNNGFDINIGGCHSGSPPGGYFAGSDGGWSAPNLESGYPADAYLTDVLTDHAVDYIRNHKDETFFLMLSHYAVHNPKQAPQAIINKYSAKIQSLQNQGVDLQGHTNATYAAMVETMDTSLGRVLDRLADPDGNPATADSILDNTLILFTSDNGGLFDAEGGATSNRPLRAGKGSVYEGGIREPFIVSWTGNSQIPQGIVNHQTRITGHDIYPTLLEITGTPGDFDHNRNIDGISFAPALTGQSVDRGCQYWHYPHYSNQDYGSALVSGGCFVSAVRKDNWKLIWFYDEKKYELYNLNDDIGETHNLLDTNLTIANELAHTLHDYLTAIDAQPPIDKTSGQPVPLPPAGIAQESPQLKAHYTFDNQSIIDSKVLDDSPNKSHAALIGPGVLTGRTGVLEQALQFPADSGESRVDVPAGIAPAGSSPRTFSLWFNQIGPGTGNQNKIFGYGSANAGQAFDVTLEGNGIRIRHYGGNITYGDNYDFIDTHPGFHHLVVRVNLYASTFADLDLFLDAQPLSVSAQVNAGVDQALDTANTILSIGSGSMATASGVYDFNGLIDDFRIYNYPLADLDIYSLWAEVSGDSICDTDKFQNPFDVTGPNLQPDCRVDLFDLTAFAGEWLSCARIPASACHTIYH